MKEKPNRNTLLPQPVTDGRGAAGAGGEGTGNLTNQELIKMFLETKHGSEKTREAYSSDLKMLVDFLPRERNPSLLFADRQQIINFLNSRCKLGKSNNTLARNLTSCREFYGFIFGEGLISSDPTIGIQTPKDKRRRDQPKCLNEQETEAIRFAAANSNLAWHIRMRDEVMIVLSYNTGIRLSELIGLLTENVDFDGKNIRVKGKGGHERIIPLDDSTANLCEGYSKKICNEFPQKKKEQKSFFLDIEGDGMTKESFSRMLKRCAISAGVRTYRDKGQVKTFVSSHFFRHTFATRKIEAGYTIDAVRSWLGHSNILTTYRYVWVSFEWTAKQLEKATQWRKTSRSNRCQSHKKGRKS